MTFDETFVCFLFLKRKRRLRRNLNSMLMLPLTYITGICAFCDIGLKQNAV